MIYRVIERGSFIKTEHKCLMVKSVSIPDLMIPQKVKIWNGHELVPANEKSAFVKHSISRV